MCLECLCSFCLIDGYLGFLLCPCGFIRVLGFLVQKGGEAVGCTGVDCDLTEAEGCIEGGLQEEEVFAARSASEEDQSHPKKAYQAPGDAPFLLSTFV